MNTKPKINQKNEIIAAPFAAGDACQLQHIRAFMGLSRRRLSNEDVLTLIDSRQIRWAWDIARKGARRPEVRIWRDSLLACLAGETGAADARQRDNLPLPQVIETILPRPVALARRAATVGLQELQRRFLCCRMHILGLISDGELCRVDRGKPGQAGQVTSVLYQSVVEFLKRRAMSA